jgi:hypothetical protein
MEHTRRIFKSMNPAALVAGLALLVAAACSASPTTPATEVASAATPASTQIAAVVPTPTRARAVVSFASDILPVFDQSCLKCHGGDKTEKGLSVKFYAALMPGSEKGAVVVPGDPDASRLAQLLLNGKMPKRGPKLSQGQIELVLEWIRAGAQNN